MKEIISSFITVPRVKWEEHVLCMGKTGVSKIFVGNLYETCVSNYGENGRKVLRCIQGKLIHEMDVEMDLDIV